MTTNETKGWEEEWDSKIHELDNPYFLDNADGEVAEFGYKITADNGYIFTITDFGNIKSFITSLLAKTKEDMKREIVGKLRSIGDQKESSHGCTRCWSDDLQSPCTCDAEKRTIKNCFYEAAEEIINSLDK